MAPPLDELLKDPEYTNWVKSGLALKITNAVLRPFVVEEIKKLHQSIVRTLPPGASCGGCRVNTGCQNVICNKIQREIEKNHWYPNPSFKNTCTGRWSTEPWEIAKCFMPPFQGYKRSAASDADFSACINVIINCKHFQNFGTRGKETDFSKSRDFRNWVMHESSQKVSEQYMEENLDILINILNKIKTPETEDDTNEAIEKIQKIKANQLTIKLEDVIEVRRTATEANADKREKPSEQVQRERLLVNFEAGCRKALCRLTEEHISKQEESDEKLSVSAFLSRMRILPERKDLCFRHKNMLFPTSGTPTDISEWDLFVYCFILELELYEPLENAASLFVREVKKIRDELLLDATGVTEDDLSELWDHLIDTDLNTEITEIFKKDSPDVDVIRSNNNLVAWWRQEEEYGNKQVFKKQLNNSKQAIKESDEKLDEKVKKCFADNQDKFIQKVIEKLKDQGENATSQGANAAGIDYVAECEIKVLGSDMETEQALQEHITSPDNNDIERNEAFDHFRQQRNLREVNPVEGSIILNVKCSSITNVIDFWDSCIDGRAVEALSKVRDYYRRYFKCDTLKFDVILTKKVVSRCVNEIVKGLPSHFERLIVEVTDEVRCILADKEQEDGKDRNGKEEKGGKDRKGKEEKNGKDKNGKEEKVGKDKKDKKQKDNVKAKRGKEKTVVPEITEKRKSKFYRRWVAALLFALLFLAFLISIPWGFVRLYQVMVAEKVSQMKLGIPAECHPEEMTFYQKVGSFLRAQLSWAEDPCLEYHKALRVDPVWHVNPPMMMARLPSQAGPPLSIANFANCEKFRQIKKKKTVLRKCLRQNIFSNCGRPKRPPK